MAKHRHGGSPLPKDAVVSMAAVPSHGLGDAKETFETIRKSDEFPFVQNKGPELAILDNSNLPQLVDYMHDVCGWSELKIDQTLRHYDVSTHHDFD